MENAKVTFNNPETQEEIIVSLKYDKDTSNLDYNVQFSEGYNTEKPMDFIGFLSNMFLNSLKD